MSFFYKNLIHCSIHKLLLRGLFLMECIILASCLPPPTPPPKPTATSIPPDSGPIKVPVFDRNDNPLMKGVVVRVVGTNQVDGDDNDRLRLDSSNDSQ